MYNMMPKGLSIFDMDVTSKGLSWVDHMYQKFEAICVEVDKSPSLLIHETTKYVENQVSVVGANVRKFCEEVIQDILPPAPEVAIKSLASNMSIEFGEEFGLSEKSKLNRLKCQTLNVESVPPHKLKEVIACAQEESDCAFPFPNKLQENPPFFHQEEASDKSKELLAPSRGYATERQSTYFHLEADACNGLAQDTLPSQETAHVVAVAEHAMGQQNGRIHLEFTHLAEKRGTLLHANAPEFGGMCLIGGIQLKSYPSPGDGVGEIGQWEEHHLEETEHCKENMEEDYQVNVEKHEDDGEKVVPVVESFIADPPNCSMV
eukprot:Gb_10247 [translate_table: standard]